MSQSANSHLPSCHDLWKQLRGFSIRNHVVSSPFFVCTKRENKCDGVWVFLFARTLSPRQQSWVLIFKSELSTVFECTCTSAAPSEQFFWALLSEQVAFQSFLFPARRTSDKREAISAPPRRFSEKPTLPCHLRSFQPTTPACCCYGRFKRWHTYLRQHQPLSQLLYSNKSLLD